MKPIILESVNGLFHAALVRPEGHRPHKVRRRQAAGSAKRDAGRARVQRRRKKGIAAARTRRAALDGKLCPANITNWHRGKLRQRGAAEGTEGRKKCATQ